MSIALLLKIHYNQHLRMKILFLPLFLLVAVLSGGCKKDNQSAENLNGSWKVHSLNGREVGHIGASCIFDIVALKISGNSGCNSYGADITVNERTQSLQIGNIVQTKIGCPGEKGDFEVDFFSALRKVNHYHFTNTEVVNLTDDQNGRIELHK